VTFARARCDQHRRGPGRYSVVPHAVLAAASPYLRLWGIVTGGWLMGRQALAAVRRLADTDTNGGFLPRNS
jgi:hypothetical protein